MSTIGSTLPFSVKFTDSAGADDDPTTVTFRLREDIDGTERLWTYDASPVEGTHYPAGTNPIVRDSEGDYSLQYVARKVERHTGFWKGTGSAPDQTKVQTFLVRYSGVVDIDSP